MNIVSQPKSRTRILCLLLAFSLPTLLFIEWMLLTTGVRPALADGTIIYVNHAASGMGTGISWTDAYTTVQAALNAATFGNEVWVAAGVYYPASDASERTAAFLLKDGVEVYGGFEGDEDNLEDRDWLVNVTVLSGDLDRNDTIDASGVVTTPTNISGSNAYHVVAASAVSGTAVLDGFILTAGQANGSDPANSGGGMYLMSGASPRLGNLVFEGNLATGNGSGLYNAGGSPDLTNVAFLSNRASNGGGLYTSSGNPDLHNTLFSGNYASNGNPGGGGGGMYIYSGSPSLVNATFAGNHAETWGNPSGGGGLHGGSSNTTLVNAIFWGNIPDQIYNSNPTITYSIFQGGYSGIGNLNVDPLFVSPVSASLAPTAAGNYRLRYGSPAIDSGNNSPVIPTTDLDDNPRIVHSTVDRGAYEYQPGGCGTEGRLYVDKNAGGDGSGLSWSNAFTNLQTALENAYNCQVWVAAGVYYPASDASDRTSAFLLKNGVEVYGGFEGNEDNLEDRDWLVNVTVLSGDLDRNDTIDASGVVTTPTNISGSNAYHVVAASAVTETAVLDGFIITAGQANGSDPANSGGGMYLMSGASPSLHNLVFKGNLATGNGGGLYNAGGSPDLTNVAFLSNRASNGGGLYTSSGNPDLHNTLFSGNYASNGYPGGGGGGMYIYSGSPSLVNATFAGNHAETWGNPSGGGGLHGGSSNTTLVNAIFWGNIPDQIYNSNPTITYSIFQGGYSGTGNQNVDPLFVSPVSASLAPTAVGNYRLRYGSPAIDSGNNSSVTTTTDLDDNPRIVHSTVDRGVYEYQHGTCTPEGALYVDKNASGDGSGLSWSNAFTNLQTALENANICEVWVAAGVYYPASDASDRTTAFLLKNGVEVYGGFAGSETSIDQRNWKTHVTVLSGDLDRNDTIDASGVVTTPTNISGSNAYHVVAASAVTETAVLDGFIITAGQANGSDPANSGGGMYLMSGASPSLHNLVFEGNLATGNGGGLYNADGSPDLTNVAFLSNRASNGGGVCTSSGNPDLHNTLFSGNYAFNGYPGGGGGGMYIYSGSPSLVNATFAGNHAETWGNPSGGGGLHGGSSNTTLVNAIFWGNIPDQIYNGNPTITYSIFQGGYSGTGNLNVDPLFVSPVSASLAPTAAGNYRLHYNSPAIDAGNNAAVPVGIVTDLAGKPRFVDSPFTSDTGEGILPIVDMGAYEFQVFMVYLPVVLK